ncbi:MAG TPA: Hpt domain-containing protein [Casimicrobiaceae bacterium]|nr:Hpt domain-containing protein [Casimicrobiaceae bacterium]
MATESNPVFDLGPLSWVQGEIDQALTRGLETIAQFKANPSDPTALKHARAHVHQAAGAIQMVGLDAVVAFTDELERQLTRMEELPPAEAQAACVVADRACRKLRIFLDELVNGAPPVPLKLYPEYEAMQLLRGIKAAAPTDLFYPDLSPRAPRIAPRESIPASRLPSRMVKQRRLYQRGMLSWLRGDDSGATTMRDAVAGIEDVTAPGSLRAFWWTVGALLEGIVENGLDRGFGVKQLCARVDLQIRRVSEGSGKVADRLRREVLYFVAICAPVAPQVQAVQRAFKLSGLIPSAEVLSADVVRLQPLLREAREQLAGAKDSWLKAASGRAENLPKLKQTLASVHAKAAEIHNGALMKLTAALVERIDKMPSGGVSESVAMEFATALLLAESAFENYTNLSPDFPKQVDAMLSRLDAAGSGRPAAASGAPMLDEMSKRAQERVLLAQVGREIQANLRHMEQVLDSFFRDNSKRAELATLGKDSQQIRGALRILGLDDADRLLALCQQQIETYGDPEATVSNDDLELLAESLSGLGFYIEAVEQQRPDRDRLIAPYIARRLGEAPAPRQEERDSVEAAVAELRSTLPGLVAEVERAPVHSAAREDLKQKLAGLRDDAELIGDSGLVAQAEAALQQLATGEAVDLAAAVDALAETTAPTPEISEETQRLLATDASELDRELLEIYLLEAAEVVDSVAASHAGLVGNPGDREALRTVRRGFHTLKGSGRMVGLVQLGDFGFDVEKICNRLLEEERAVTPAVLAMIEVAERNFRTWIDALTRTGRVTADPRELHAAIAVVEAELSGRQPVAADEPDVPVAHSNVFELPKPAPSAPLPPSPPDLIELPELGAGEPLEATPGERDVPAVESIEVIELPVVNVNEHVGENVGEYVDEVDELPAGVPKTGAPGPEPSAPILKLVSDRPRAEIERAHAPAAEPEEITIGGTTLSFSLWKILVDEARQHLLTLENELSILQFDSHAVPSAEMIRAGHTLCGIHRTGGFPLVATVALALEQTLLALAERGAPLPSSTQPVLARTVAGLSQFARRIEAREAFTPADQSEAALIESELDELRQETASVVQDAEGAAVAEARQQEDADAVAHSSPAEAYSVVDEVPPGAAAIDAAPRGPTFVEPGTVPDAHAVATQESAQRPQDELPDEIVLPLVEEDPLATIRDDVDAQVLPIFLDEAAELFPQAGEELRAWRRNPHDSKAVAELRRTLHTFKGSARMAGAMRLGELSHLMESQLLDGETPAGATPALFEALETALDHMAFLLDRLRNGETNTPLPWVARTVEEPVEVAEVPQVPAAPIVERPVVVPFVPPVPVPTAIPAAAPAAPAFSPAPKVAATAPAHADATPELETGARAQLRVRADLIDRLVNEAGEVAIARARVEGELRSLKSNLLELTNSVIRLRSQMREIEIQAESQIQSQMSLMQEQASDFDPLEFDRYTRFQELTRSLAEGINDVSTVQHSLLKNLDDADAALLAQARLSRDVQQRLFSIRTVPFGSLSERLYRVLRTTAKELDKRANLEINGGKVELDRSVLEKLVGPLEHLLRNALDHGIEGRDARVKAGKPETGEVSLTVRQVGNEVVIELADDGAGVDFARVRERSRSLGLFPADASPSDAQLIEFLFQPGFSTASKVTQISGRGIGMDVVRSEVAALGGRVEVATTLGKGTRFTLTMPLTLAVAQAVLVRAGGRLWALPAPMVEQVQQIKSQTLLDLYIKRKVEWQGRDYPFHYLPRLLGDTQHNPETLRYNSVLLLRSGQTYAAIHVDEMVGTQEVVVKNIGPQLARVSGISGATVLGSGEIVLIINPVQLAGRADVPKFDPADDERAVGDHPRAPVAAVSTQPLVMIVDDSLTVRKITSRLLQREGFAVTTAKDGVDALQLLGEQMPDIILLDIEMPRMDGFEFAKTIKGDPKYANIPIIMITSRTAEKHRSRAAELGVDMYLGKPYQEDELLRHLREMTGIAAPY